MRVSDISSVIIMISSRTGSMMADITEAVQLSTALAVPASVVVAITDMVNVVVTVNTTEVLWYDGSEREGNEGQSQGEEVDEDIIIIDAVGDGMELNGVHVSVKKTSSIKFAMSNCIYLKEGMKLLHPLNENSLKR